MAAVLAACVLGPVSTVYTVGPVAMVLSLPLLAVQLGVTLGVGVHPGSFTSPDYVTGGTLLGLHMAGTMAGTTLRGKGSANRKRFEPISSCPAAALVSLLLSAYFLLFMYTTLWRRMETYFSAFPWLRCSLGDLCGQPTTSILVSVPDKGPSLCTLLSLGQWLLAGPRPPLCHVRLQAQWPAAVPGEHPEVCHTLPFHRHAPCTHFVCPNSTTVCCSSLPNVAPLCCTCVCQCRPAAHNALPLLRRPRPRLSLAQVRPPGVVSMPPDAGPCLSAITSCCAPKPDLAWQAMPVCIQPSPRTLFRLPAAFLQLVPWRDCFALGCRQAVH
jgi:hypothetical protein